MTESRFGRFLARARSGPDGGFRSIREPGEALRTGCWLLATALAACFVAWIFPGLPSDGRIARVVFLVAGTWTAFSTIVPWRWFRRIVSILLAVVAMVPYGFFYVSLGWLSLFVLDRTVFVASALLVLVVLVAVLLLAFRPGMRTTRRVVVSLVVLGNVLLTPLVLVRMWSPPSVERCEEAIEPGVTSRLTPASLPQELSYPYSMLYLPREQLLVATVKMAGNLLLDFWNDPEANRILAVDVRDPEVPVLQEVARTGPEMPENIAYDGTLRRVFVTRLGSVGHHLDSFGIGPDRRLVALQSVPVHPSPNPVISIPENGTVLVFGQETTYSVFRASDLAPLAGPDNLLDDELEGQNTVDAQRPDGFRWAYFYLMGTSIGALDVLSHERKLAEAPVGFGRLYASLETKRLYRTNSFRNTFEEYDLDTLALLDSHDLGFTPRSFVVDARNDLLIVPAWFDSQIHFFRLSTMERLGSPIPAGPYIRDAGYDPDRHLLFHGSKCGVFLTRLDRILDFHDDGSPATPRP